MSDAALAGEGRGFLGGRVEPKHLDEETVAEGDAEEAAFALESEALAA